MLKNAIFQNSIIFFKVAGNMIFGRKFTLWTPESPQKAYIDHPTHYGQILRKIKKFRFLTSKIQKNIFSGRLFRPMCPGHQNNIGDQNIIYVPQRPYNVTLPPLSLHTYTGLEIYTGLQPNPLFFGFSHIYTYICLIYI